ncbi:hypothetical protein C1879_06345 [Paraeggerthella hongkongensis]|nr:hypothetical protein C1879_06345 [Paraeggerthella hongkongensis]
MRRRVKTRSGFAPQGRGQGDHVVQIAHSSPLNRVNAQFGGLTAFPRMQFVQIVRVREAKGVHLPDAPLTGQGK